MEDNPLQAQNCLICETRSALWPTFGDYLDFDCPEYGRIRITGSALSCFPPKSIAKFDRLWLVSWVKRIPAENGPYQNRRLITAAYLARLWPSGGMAKGISYGALKSWTGFYTVGPTP